MNPIQLFIQTLQARFIALKQFIPVKAVLALVLASLPSISFGAVGTWGGGTSTAWNTGANWSGGVVPSGAWPDGVATINSIPANICTISANPSAAPSDIIVGSSGTGRVNQTGGVVTTAGANWLLIGGGGTGTYDMTGGTLNLGDIHMARVSGTTGTATLNVGGTVTATGAVVASDGQNNTATAVGTINVNSGGTLNSGGDLILSWAGNSSTIGTLNIASGATVNAATTAERWLIVNQYDASQGRLTVNGGTLNLNYNTDIRFSPGNGVGTSFVTLNSGAITAWNGNQTGAAVSSVVDLNRAGNLVNNTFNLNGGTLTINQIVSTLTTGTRVFNFNGGTLKPAADSATFFASGRASTANVRNGGAIINTDGKLITIGQALVHSTVGGDAATDGGLTKTNTGTLTLTGVNTYTGGTVIKNGTLALGTGGSINNSSSITVSNSATFDVSAIGYTLGGSQSLQGSGTVNGAVNTTSGSQIYAALDTTAGTITFNNNLTMVSGATLNLDLSASASSGNDKMVVGGTLALNSTVINIKGPGTLDTSDYTLATASSITGTPTVNWVGSVPSNTGDFTVINDGTSIKLHFAGAPTLTASASPASLGRNQPVTITALVTPGTIGNVASVTVDLTPIGGSSSASLAYSNSIGSDQVWTNTFTVSAGTSAGAKLLTLTAANDSTPTPYTGNAIAGFSVTTGAVTWDGGGADDNFTSNMNWLSDYAPGLSGDNLTFAGTTRLTPNMDNNYSVTALTFDNTAGSFTLGTASSTLTLTGGVTNNSMSAQTLNVPIVVNGVGSVNAAAGDVIVSNAVSGVGSLTKTGNGTLTLAGGYTASGALQVNGGTGIVSSAVSPGSSQVLAGEGSGSVGTITVNAGGTLTANNLLAAGRNGGTGTINVNGGTITQTANNISAASLGAGVTGTLNLNSGTITSSGEIWIGESGTAVGNQSGGDITSGAWFVVGRGNGSVGTYNLSGGTVTAATTTVGSFGVIGSFTGSQGTLNVSGGSFTVAASRRLYVGEGGTGTLNVSGTGLVTVNDPINGGLRLGVGSTGVGTVNLNGGTVQAMMVGKGSGLGTNNFNGGTLRAGMSTNTFMTGLTRANVRNGGAVIDSAGFDITIGQALLHSDIGGDNATDGGLTKTGNGTLTLTGSGTGLFTGPVNVGGGTLYANAGNAANNRTFSFVSSLTVSNGATLQSGPNGLFGWDGTQEKPVTVNSGGTLTANGGLTSDVGVGTVTLAGGTLATLAVGATDWGSWRFDNPGDVLAATENSTVSAANVKFQNGGAIDVAATKTLNFTGTITDSSNGGVSTVVKSGGTGTLDLSGANTYTGNTTVSAGTLALSGGGSINNTPVISLASGTTLDVTAGGFVLGPAQTLNGNGAVLGATILLGTVAPGTSIGTLTFDTAPNLSGAVVMEISTPSNADKIVFSGGANFGGTLTVTNVGASLTNGNTFDLFDGTLSGSFSTLNLPGGESHWDTSDLNVGGTLTFTNASPVATNLTLGCMLGESVSLQVIGGKNAPTDADNDSMTVTGVGPASSGTSGNTATSVTYVATGFMGTNTFTYTVTDALGATDTKTVTVIVSNPQGFNQVSATNLGGNTLALSYLGIPGYNYALDWATNLSAPINWMPVVTNTAQTNGWLNFTNTGVGMDFYRTRYVP